MCHSVHLTRISLFFTVSLKLLVTKFNVIRKINNYKYYYIMIKNFFIHNAHWDIFQTQYSKSVSITEMFGTKKHIQRPINRARQFAKEKSHKIIPF
jgi:hypothetical protein